MLQAAIPLKTAMLGGVPLAKRFWYQSSDNKGVFMSVKFSRIISSSLIACMLSQMVACGTILHPERKGQTAGQIDPAIAVFNAVGLLFFLIPGVIAFAVDFNNGTIYLPSGRRSDLSPEEMHRIKGQDGFDRVELAKALHDRGIDVDAADLQGQPLSSLDEIQSKIKSFSVAYASAQ